MTRRFYDFLNSIQVISELLGWDDKEGLYDTYAFMFSAFSNGRLTPIEKICENIYARDTRDENS